MLGSARCVEEFYPKQIYVDAVFETVYITTLKNTIPI